MVGMASKRCGASAIWVFNFPAIGSNDQNVENAGTALKGQESCRSSRHTNLWRDDDHGDKSSRLRHDYIRTQSD